MILEDEPVSFKDKVFRVIIGVFLFILVGTLVITLLPGDAEQNLYNMISGKTNLSAGKVGEENISFDYFNAARKECYDRYKQYGHPSADDQAEINRCAYNNIKELKVMKALAHASGYLISELSIREELSAQAKAAYQQSTASAGYSKEEMQSPEEIYRYLLRSMPIAYRQDIMIAYSYPMKLFMSNLKKSENELSVENDAKNLNLSISFVAFSDIELFNVIGDNIPVSEDDIKRDYDESVKNGSIAKDAKGNFESLESRKPFILNKLKLNAKQKMLSELKTKIQNVKSGSSESILQEIAKLAGVKPVDVANSSITEFANNINKANGNKQMTFASSSSFLKDLVEIQFGKNKIGGPYTDGDKTVYVEFKEIKYNTASVAKTDQEPQSNRMFVYNFLTEINQSMAGLFPIFRKVDRKIQDEE